MTIVFCCILLAFEFSRVFKIYLLLLNFIFYSYFQCMMICAELAGDFHLGYARQLTDKSSLLFDLAF